MPCHVGAAIAAVAGYSGAQGCEGAEQTLSEDDYEKSQVPLEVDPNASPSAAASPLARGYLGNEDIGSPVHLSGRSVRFSERMVGSEGVRSMYSERPSNNLHRHMEVRLRSIGSIHSDDETPFDSLSGFVGGDFAAGKVKDIKLPTGCWTMAFSKCANLLAVGLKYRVDFLETTNYTIIYSLPRSDKVSAIHWCQGSSLCPKTTLAMVNNTIHRDGDIIAVAGLDGKVTVYQLDADLLELQGVKVLYEFQVHSQVRSMVIRPLGRGKLVLAVGDKQGKITLVTLARDDLGKIDGSSAVVDLGKDPVLGLDIHAEQSILAASTRSGKVIVYQLLMTSYRMDKSYVVCSSRLWMTQRSGAVRAIIIAQDGKQIAFGGYDKTLVLVDTNLYAVVRELSLAGTINTIATDPLGRFLVVGSRDKSLTFYDTTTYFPIKRFQTPGWVTSISWGVPGIWSDVVAVRSENKGISLLDLTPINMTDIELSSQEGFGTSITWSPDGEFLARLVGDSIHITDSRYAFCSSAHITIPGSSLRSIAFSPRFEESEECNYDDASLLAAVGLNGNVYMLKFTVPHTLELVESVFVEKSLWVVTWSKDAKLLATGGKEKTLNVFSTETGKLIHKQSIKLDGRIWDIGFVQHHFENKNGKTNETCAMAVASGDYKTIFFDEAFQPTLQVIRSRTVRCLDYHPNSSLVAVGDGAGIVAIVDYREEETVAEFEVGGRVNVVKFSPAGDYLLVGTDDCVFTLREAVQYRVVQEFQKKSFAIAGSFSTSGKYLALGCSNETYSVVRLGPLLGIDFVPLSGGMALLPPWAQDETLFRSGYGPSLVQRHMIHGSQDSLQWVASTLKEYPDAIYTVNRFRKEGCLDTALRLQKMKLLRLAVTTLVNGSLDSRNGGRRSILTTDIPEIGRKTLEAMIAKHHPDLIVQILKEMTFVKVPFTRLHVVSRDKKMFCASPHYLDPWTHYCLVDSDDEETGTLTKTAAVLPFPGLGTMSFLSALVSKAPATAFDNEAMALVLRVMWQNHIRKYFIIDTIFFFSYFFLWIFLIDSRSSATVNPSSASMSEKIVAITILALNTLFFVKEVVQSDLGRRPGYFWSVWNQVDIGSIILVYGYAIFTGFYGSQSEGLVPLAVVTTLLLTMKLISYLRAFHETGWLVTVLSQNFRDVRGFLVVLLSILLGFSTSFRLLFAGNEPTCEVEMDEETGGLVQNCYEPFGSLRKSILSTFELTILGSYEPSMLYESQFSTLSILTFVLAVTCILVVALNALISLLADSYARVQEHATANKRKEQAELIVEYMALLTPWRRRKIEKNTKFFHALLEADADGDLVLPGDDWRGGMNALQKDIEETNKFHAELHQKALENLKQDFDRDLSSFRGEIISLLQDLSEEIKTIKKNQESSGLSLGGKRVAGAVKEIRRKGTEFLKSPKE